MAESPAARQRRSRAHRGGDHSLCGARCIADRVTALVHTAPAPATVTAAVDALIAELRFDPGDPRSVSLAVCRQLAVALDTDPGSTSAALRITAICQWIAQYPNEPADRVDELRARAHVKLIDMAARRAR